MEGIYLGGWATSAKGSVAEDPGPDLASYPLGQVPDEAAGLVRALLNFSIWSRPEVPTKLLEEWLAEWSKHSDYAARIRVQLRPHTAGSELLELSESSVHQPSVNQSNFNRPSGEKLANVFFGYIQDRRGRHVLSIRDQNTLPPVRKKRLMTVTQLFLIHRYNASAVHYVTPTEDNEFQTQRMKSAGIFSDVHTEIGQITVAQVNKDRVAELLKPDRRQLSEITRKTSPALLVQT
jgi:isocitrate lyase